mmetsp:Transcript_823/g.1495  ORF Transcript_823/g.1495 Transcript_823/m.1495 type:complete len:207 (-) Transcript_823:480-1100(-)
MDLGAAGSRVEIVHPKVKVVARAGVLSWMGGEGALYSVVGRIFHIDGFEGFGIQQEGTSSLPECPQVITPPNDVGVGHVFGFNVHNVVEPTTRLHGTEHTPSCHLSRFNIFQVARGMDKAAGPECILLAAFFVVLSRYAEGRHEAVAVKRMDDGCAIVCVESAWAIAVVGTLRKIVWQFETGNHLSCWTFLTVVSMEFTASLSKTT